MKHLRGAAIAIAALGLSFGPANPVTAANPAQPGIEGKWQGDFGAGPWTFEFSKASGGWSARYTHPKYNGWNQVRNLSASATSAKFSIDAKPAMAFKMDLEKSRNGLAGTLKVAGTQTPPTDPLVVPFELKRVP